MFLYDTPVSRAALEPALGSSLVSLLDNVGLVRSIGEDIEAAFRLTPMGATLVLSDRPQAGRDAVMPPGPTTADLLAVLPQQFDGTCLDVGAGPGTLGLALARRGGSVTVTDVNGRASRTAALNARLNGLQLEVAEGDLLAPVAGRRFDLVVSQPPWVALPRGVDAVTYLHGGSRGDEVLMRLLAELPSALTPDGVALLRVDAPVFRDDDDISGRIARCLDGLGGLLVTAPGLTADHQAVGYGSVVDPTLGAGYRKAVVDYRDHLEEIGVEAVRRSIAFLTPRAPVLHHLETQRLPRDADTLSMLAAGQALATAPQKAFDGARLTTLPGTVSSRSSEGRTVRSPLGPSLMVDERVAKVVEACALEEPTEGVAVDDVDAVREALRIGVLVPRMSARE
jgi:SAM-dependent methyltransferase